MTDNKIFISIASYRDPELLPTIRDCIKRAKHPENLVFAIAWQHSNEDEWDNLEEFKGDERFRIIDIPHDTSNGTCWARNLAQKEYKGEAYTLQLDSHHRFVNHWDTLCIDMIKQLQDDGYKKPLLTAYLPSYDPENDPKERKKEVWKLNLDRFIPEGAVFMIPSLLENWESKKAPVPTRFFSAHFVFTFGQFNTEVVYDPNLYFHGEEITLAVRAYTHGYDLFTPNKIVAWHEYTRKGRIRHWDENKRWEELNKSSLIRAKKLLGVDNIDNDIEFGEYGFGNERSKEDYERYAGIRFGDRAVQNYTLTHHQPPNPIYNSEEVYEQSFVNIFKHCIDVHVSSIPDKDWDYWAVIFEMDDGTAVYRHDADREEIKQITERRLELGGDWYNIWREYNTKVIPDKAIVWPFSTNPEIGWGPKIEVKVNKL